MLKHAAPLLYSLVLFCLLAVPGQGALPKKQNAASAASESVEKVDEKIPLSLKNVVGNWGLKYSGNYGYFFSLSRSYRAVVIIYLNTQAFIFKGVYAIDDKNNLKINISEMKNDPKITGINLQSGFVKAKSSHFLFNGYKIKKNSRESMFLEPRSIIIDGNNSEGYFEPVLKLIKNS